MVSLRISTSKICVVVMWQTYFFATEKANKLALENGVNLWKMEKISYYPIKYSKMSWNFLHANFAFVQIFLLFVYCFFFCTIYLLFHCVSQSLSIIYHYLQNKAFHISCFSDMSWVSCTKHSQNFAKSLKNTPVNEFIPSKFKFKSTKKELVVRLFLRIFLKY